MTSACRVADLRSKSGLTSKDGVNNAFGVNRQVERLPDPDVGEHRTVSVGTNEDRLHTWRNSAATQIGALL